MLITVIVNEVINLKCVVCGNEIPDDSKFCPSCGKNPKPETVMCSKCGQKIETGQKFCVSCGTSVGTGAQTSVPPTQSFSGQQPNRPPGPQVPYTPIYSDHHHKPKKKGGCLKIVGIGFLVVVVAIVGLYFMGKDKAPESNSVSQNTQTTQSTNSSANFISEFNMSENIKNDTMEPINVTDKYAPDAPKFFVTAKLDNAPTNTAVVFDWFYVESGDQKIDSANVTADGTRFISSNLTRGNNLWPAGKYEVRISVNGSQIVKVPYMVEGGSPTSQNNPPQQTSQTTESNFISNFNMCTGVKSDTMEPMNITSQFTPTTQMFYVSAKLDNAPENTNVKFEWYFMGAKQLIDTAVVTTGGTRFISSNLSKSNNAWPVGEYEVRIYVNGSPVKIVPFIVQ
jgi:predicted nucleic acid-binding Zn ribbon protein